MFTFLHRVIVFAFISGCLSLFSVDANAHLMPTGHGTINVTGSKLYIIISVPAASFKLDGTRGKGLLNAEELKENSEKIHQQLRDGFLVSTQDGSAPFKKILLNLPSGGGPTQAGKNVSKDEHDQDTNEDLMIMVVAQAKTTPTSITIRSALWASDQDSIKFKTTISEGAKTLASELGTITATNPEYVFFASSKHVVLSSMQSGFTHLIAGWDHLLFILLMLSSCFVLKRWTVLLISFTAAHTLSFAALSLGWVAFPVFSIVPVSWIESVILASLLIAAIPIFLRWRPPLFFEAIIVLVLGLFHGLGFASAMAGAQEYNHLVGLKIAGFNVGAFLAQLLIASVLFAIFRITQGSRQRTDS